MFLHRCQHTQVALNSPGVAIADVADNHLHKFLLTGETPAIIAFLFQDAPETFHGSIVNTVSDTGHTLYHSCLYKFLVKCSACILVAAVTVEQRMCVRIEFNSPVKGLEYERIVIALTERIGHDAPVTEVQNSAQIELMYLNNLTKQYGITPSMSRRGNPYDNAMAENFFSILKTECIYRHKPATFSEANEMIDRYIHFYNHERIQLKTGEPPLARRLSY